MGTDTILHSICLINCEVGAPKKSKEMEPLSGFHYILTEKFPKISLGMKNVTRYWGFPPSPPHKKLEDFSLKVTLKNSLYKNK